MVKPWRVPEYHFQVSWSWGVMSCQEIIGLEDVHPAENSGGASAYLSEKMGGGQMPGNIVLKHISLSSCRGFRGWLNQFQAGRPEPMPATVSLIFDEKPPCVIWALNNAWPVLISPVDAAEEDGADVLIDSISLTHSGMTIVKG